MAADSSTPHMIGDTARMLREDARVQISDFSVAASFLPGKITDRNHMHRRSARLFTSDTEMLS
jgi:hypothetical protein